MEVVVVTLTALQQAAAVAAAAAAAAVAAIAAVVTEKEKSSQRQNLQNYHLFLLDPNMKYPCHQFIKFFLYMFFEYIHTYIYKKVMNIQNKNKILNVLSLFYFL